ncbi:MAG: hypothetical protein AAB592_01105 [Patescibacteria group bacterium]
MNRLTVSTLAVTTALVSCGPEGSATYDRGARFEPVENDHLSADAGTVDTVRVQFSCAVSDALLEERGAIDMEASEIVVHDLDTIRDASTTYRFSAVDGAECEACFGDSTGWPDQYGTGADTDVNYCERGKVYVETAIGNAQRVRKVTGRLDDNGRRLGYFVVDNDLLNCLVVRDGVAWETVSHYGLGSHPPLAQLVADAAEFSGDPHFEEPYLYKQHERGTLDECR